jgi:hypothetical protein
VKIFSPAAYACPGSRSPADAGQGTSPANAMSLSRPLVKRETDLYTDVEKRILTLKPGITDFSSIVFSDENDILKDSKDLDIQIAYKGKPQYPEGRFELKCQQ